jgi:hypothetical protein
MTLQPSTLHDGIFIKKDTEIKQTKFVILNLR